MASIRTAFLCVTLIVHLVCNYGGFAESSTVDCIVPIEGMTDECRQFFAPTDSCQLSFCYTAPINEVRNPNLCAFNQYSYVAAGCPLTDIPPTPDQKLCTEIKSGKCFKDCRKWNSHPDFQVVGNPSKPGMYTYSYTAAYKCKVWRGSYSKHICACSQIGSPL